MWVVKLGGSLYDSPQLRRWLEVLACAEPAVVIVPGDGPFADQVRAVQQRWGIDDQSAHAMALSAMDQFGVHFFHKTTQRFLTPLQPGKKENNPLYTAHYVVFLYKNRYR